MSNSPSPPTSSPLPLSDAAGGASAWDRLESDIKALQQQALATQKTIQQVQAREPSSPLDAVQLELPRLPAVDGTVVGMAAVLGLSMAVLWWYLWHRPQTRLNQTLDVPTANVPPPPVQRPPADASAAKIAATRTPPIEQTAPDTTQAENSDCFFARHDPNLGFDSEAAANEVVRVRKFLAKKREARALQRESEEADGPVPSVRAWLDQDTPHPARPPTPEITPDAPDIALDLTLDEPERPKGHDYAITLALAQESEALDLWPEARELAGEVLESSHAELRAEAQALLERLDHLEQVQAQESLPPHDEP